MIFLPDPKDLSLHIEGMTGLELCVIQDRKDALRVSVYNSASRDRREYHVFNNPNGTINHVELCPARGKLSDGKTDYRFPVPSLHPDLSYKTSAMLHVAREVIAETGISNLFFSVDYENNHGDKRFTSNFIAKKKAKDQKPVSLSRGEQFHMPKAVLLKNIGAEIARHFEFEISNDGYGGELQISIDEESTVISFDSEDDENRAGFKLESRLIDGVWKHTTQLWCEPDDDPVTRMAALSNPLESFENRVCEHENLTAIIPINYSKNITCEIEEDHMLIFLEPGSLFAHDSDLPI